MRRMEIKRDLYLQRLIDRMHNGMIKVVTGIRRCGKSYLILKIFRDYLFGIGVDPSHILQVALDLRENAPLRDPDAILAHIRSLLLNDGQWTYIFLDEVQLLPEFEDVLNSLLHIPTVDVYVTGSNSRFLSKDVITEFRGRGDEVHLFPLSFREFMSVYTGDVYHGWADYVLYGGLPMVSGMRTEAQKIGYLTSLFEETYLRDILDRYHIEKVHEMNDLINVLASGVGSLTNPSKIQATFKSVLHSDISINTIHKYLSYLRDAYIVEEAHRYDVKGRRYIGTPLKYYFEDIGLRNARLGFRQIEETHLMENVIYNELRIRGYQVDVGVVQRSFRGDDGKTDRRQLEIDFLANLGSKRYYLQSAYSLPDREKVLQEKMPLISANDDFKKIVIVKDVIRPQRDERGIVTMSVYDFLLNEYSLEL